MKRLGFIKRAPLKKPPRNEQIYKDVKKWKELGFKKIRGTSLG